MLFREEYKKNNEAFQRRLIRLLEIPTYDKQTKVMFYDVLMKLCHQIVKKHFLGPRLKKTMINLNFIRRLGGKVFHDDELEALSYRNPIRKDIYDTGLIELFE